MHTDFVYTRRPTHFSRLIHLTFYLVTITAIPIVHTVLSSHPSDTEAVVGQTVRLNCSTSDRYYVLWEHTPVGAANYEYVFFSGRIITPYHLRHRIEGNSSAGEYHLVITNVQLSDAGLYGCVDQAGHGERREAQLIVLDSRPTCNSSEEVMGENPCSIPEDQVKIRCMIGYSGNRPPVLKCGVKDDTSTDVVASLTETSNNKATYDSALSINNMRDKDSTLVCRTSLFKIAANDLYTKVLYVSKDKLTRHLDHPGQLSCFIKSTQPCRYKWSHEHHDSKTDLNGDVIWANKTGSYRCEAECILRNKQCIAVPLIFHFSETETTSQLPQGQDGTPNLVYILVPLCTILLVVTTGIVLIFLLRKCRPTEILKPDLKDCDMENGESAKAGALLRETEDKEKPTENVTTSNDNVDKADGSHEETSVEHSPRLSPTPSTSSSGSDDSNTPLIQQTSQSKIL